MADYKNLIFEVKDGLGFVTINREKSLNALNSELLAELKELFTSLKTEDSVKAVVVTGKGRAFVAGADISEMKDLSTMDLREMAIGGQRAMDAIEDLDKPVIAAVNGFALGGGCELAMACDIRLASEKAKFGQPEVNLGILPFFGGTQRLSRLVGKGMAKYMILSAEMIGAEDALKIGLVEKVYAEDQLFEEAEKLARLIMTKSPIGVKMAINAVNTGVNVDLKSGLAYEIESAVNCFASEDRTEGMRAFLEKETPDFKNR